LRTSNDNPFFSIILLKSRVAAVAGLPQLRNPLPELCLVFSAACIERILGRGLGLFVEEVELLPDMRVGKS
jgi:hypothetical protein